MSDSLSKGTETNLDTPESITAYLDNVRSYLLEELQRGCTLTALGQLRHNGVESTGGLITLSSYKG